MGKKGSKRKTRWRTLSIGAPPGGEDEEDGLRNGYVKDQQNDRSRHGFDRNGQVDYTNGTSKSRRDESTGSQSQSKIIVNEDEYTRITAPRQDVLFKKSYLSCKKPWASNASTSATPSTTESQSASHSTADGSEMTEDQQLLDGDSAMGEYPPRGANPEAQVGYGTFYNHNSGYYYGYPVMLVGPAPISSQMEPSVLAAVPCSSVPLRPIEWVNPAFVPNGQSYCLMNNKVHYQSGQTAESQPIEPEEHSNALVPVENSYVACYNSGTGSVSYSGSMLEEVEEPEVDETNVTKEETAVNEYYPTEKTFQDVDQVPVVEETDKNDAPYIDPIVMPQPAAVHVPHVIPAIPEPYMYPGHYMFGPPLVNVNGVTIQGELMIRTTDITKMTSAAYTRRGKKKKRWRQRRAASGDAEDDEDDYSFYGKSGLSSSRTSWSTCPSLDTSTVTTTTTVTETANRPLNPECEEFRLRPKIERYLAVVENPPATLKEAYQLVLARTASLKIEEGEISSNIGNNSESNYNNNPCKDTTSMEEIKSEAKDNNHEPMVMASMKTNQEVIDSSTNANNRLINYLSDDDEMVNSSKNEKKVSARKKYNGKTLKLVREPTPGPTSSDECETNENVEKVTQAVIPTQLESTACILKDTEAMDRVSSESASDIGNDNADNKTASEDIAECSNDSGFETQTCRPVYRITEAVTEWLQRANSPDVFITATMISDSSDTEDDDLEDEPSKNLQGNPMPALSVNSMADDRVSSCMASCSKFAKINNIDENRQSHKTNNDHKSKKVTLRSRGSKIRSTERLTRKTVDKYDERSEKGVFSSSDSCEKQEFSGSTITTLRKRRKDVAGVCEFTEKDSIADMRVATSSRINSKRNIRRRVRRSDKSSRRPAESLDVKIRRDEGRTDDPRCMMSVKTFEKGEIVVSVDGKFVQISPFPQLLHCVETNVSENEKNAEEIDKKIPGSSEEIEMERIETKTRSSVTEDEIDKMTASLVSIEEPDVLECWEAETIEPITPKRVLQSHGVSYEGEAAEEENFHTEPGIVEHVQKYYRLARESATSIEDDTYEGKINVLLNTKPFNKSRVVPNNPVQLIRGYQGEEIPVIMPNEKCGTLEERNIPVDEAFEVYENCYTDKAQSLTLGSIFKTHPLFPQQGEGPVPCRAVCCSIQ